MGIYTSRYSNKELADGKYYCVGISIGTPKFKLAYRLENQCYSLAPKGYMLRMNLEDFKKAYYEKLNGIGKDRIINMVMKMERDASAQGKDLVLLCYEDVRIPEDWCTELYIAKVQLAELKEQDINARIMKNEMQDQLTANIKNRGQLESLPLIALMGEKLEIISGHHRVKSAREAGLKEIIVILDKSGLTRSKAASKQLAHNAISGFDDESTLREIVKLMDNVDDMMESYIGKEILEEPLEQFDKLNTPAVQFDFKTIAFAFLPNQIRDLDALMKNLNGSCAEIIGVAAYEQCEKFVETLDKYQQFTDIRNVGAAVHSMIDAANEKMDDAGFDPDMDWTYLAKVFGSAAIPVESAEVIKKALKKAEKDGTITSKNKWQMIEYWAADYLAGK